MSIIGFFSENWQNEKFGQWLFFLAAVIFAALVFGAGYLLGRNELSPIIIEQCRQ